MRHFHATLAIAFLLTAWHCTMKAPDWNNRFSWTCSDKEPLGFNLDYKEESISFQRQHWLFSVKDELKPENSFSFRLSPEEKLFSSTNPNTGEPNILLRGTHFLLGGEGATTVRWQTNGLYFFGNNLDSLSLRFSSKSLFDVTFENFPNEFHMLNCDHNDSLLVWFNAKIDLRDTDQATFYQDGRPSKFGPP